MTGLLLSFLAGISTTIGSLIVFCIKDFKKCYLAFSLAFSTGVMIMISFIELLPAGITAVGYAGALLVFSMGQP